VYSVAAGVQYICIFFVFGIVTFSGVASTARMIILHRFYNLQWMSVTDLQAPQSYSS